MIGSGSVEPNAHGFAGAMAALWKRRRTAYLSISAQDLTTTISFLDGVPVWASGGAKSETLGRLCVRIGLLTEAQYEKAILRMAELDTTGKTVRLGDVLIDLGFFDSARLHQALRIQVREKIVACFQWDPAEVTIEADRGEIRRANLVPWPVPAVLAEGVVRWFDDERCDRVLAPELNRHVRLFGEVSVAAALLNVPSELVAPFDQHKRLGELIDDTPLSKQLATAMLMLGFFELVGTDDLAAQLELPSTIDLRFGGEVDEATPTEDLRPAIEAEHQRIASSTPEEYLGVDPSATPAQIQTAFEQRVKPFVAAALQESSAKQQARLTEVYNAIAAQRDSLLERGAPVPSAPPNAQVEAEAAFLRGKQMLESGDRKAASALFSQAIEKSPGTREYHMFRAYTDMMLAQTDWDRDKATAETKKFAKETLEQDAKNAKAHLILGRLLRLEGKEERSRQCFEKAAELGDKEAERELRLLERRQAKKEKSGLFFWRKP